MDKSLLHPYNTQSFIATEIITEFNRASYLLPRFNSLHEGLGVIMEEFDEFKAEVYAYNLRKNRDTRPHARAELIQLAAMCMRTIIDLDLERKDEKEC